MRFINDDESPDLPERLLHFHENGKVIFFCGAGISYNAGLPGFKKLVSDLYNKLKIPMNDEYKFVFDNNQLDLSITLIERKTIFNRERITKEIFDILKNPNLNYDNLLIHNSLVKLAKNQYDKVKLITTNFDGIFEHIREKEDFNTYCAPYVPLVNSDWNGIVYLHGLLKENNKNFIIVSSSDFGQAYLVDQWASRFLVQIFQQYSVCFIGYSLNDPIIRYITDAISASRDSENNYHEIFAFCGYNKKSKGNKRKIEEEWNSKGVTPISYNEKYGHKLLKETLNYWACSYEKGVGGKILEITKMNRDNSLSSPIESNYKKIIWALGDSSGKPAEAFANMNPVFDLSWLYTLYEKTYTSDDNIIFGIKNYKDGSYSLLNKPYSENEEIPTKSIIQKNYYHENNDLIFNNIYVWLIRHINNPDLIIWISKNGGLLNNAFKSEIQKQLDIFNRWENSGEEYDIEKEEYLRNNPNGIPNREMIVLWNLILADKLCPNKCNLNLLMHFDNLANGLNINNKYILINSLTPYLIISKDHKNIMSLSNNSIYKYLYLRVELSQDVTPLFYLINDFNIWKKDLKLFIFDFILLLKEYYDLIYELGGKDSEDRFNYNYIEDISKIDVNSIDSNDNELVLVFFLWTSWVELNIQDSNYANDIIKIFWNLSYPMFKRLTLTALLKQESIDFDFVYNCCKYDKCNILWSYNTNKEMIKLIELIVKSCDKKEIKLIENLILSPYGLEYYKGKYNSKDYNKLYEICLFNYLEILKKTECLSKQNIDKYNEINKKYDLVSNNISIFKTKKNSRCIEEINHRIKPFPKDRTKLISYIKDHQQLKFFDNKGSWKSYCIDNPIYVCEILLELYENKIDSFDWWNDVFYYWCENDKVPEIWEMLSTKLVNYSDSFFEKCGSALIYWLKSFSSTNFMFENAFLNLINKIIENSSNIIPNNKEYIFQAINNPVGISCITLQNWWFTKKPTLNSLIKKELNTLYTKICKEDDHKYIYGKVILASNILFFYQVDPIWTREKLFPLFDYKNNKKNYSIGMWQGFLSNPEYNISLIEELIDYLIDISNHKQKLGIYKKQYLFILTSINVYYPYYKRNSDICTIILNFNSEDLIVIVNCLKNIIETLDDDINEIWKKNIEPFIKKSFPKTKNIKSEKLTEEIAILCVSSGKIFDKVFDQMELYLTPLKNPENIFRLIEKNNLYNSPNICLKFISKLVASKSVISKYSILKNCLKNISIKDSQLEQLRIYQNLLNRL